MPRAASDNAKQRGRKRAKTTSDNAKRFAGAFADYEKWLARQPLAENSRRVYRRGVADFVDWLATAELDREDPLADPHARDFAVRDWRRHLREDLKRSPSTVNTKLASVDNFYISLGLGPANAPRDELPEESPRALEPPARRRLLRAIETRPSIRDRAICALLFYSAIRVAECAGLELDDVAVSARKGKIVIRGKGGRTRTVHLNEPARTRLAEYLAERVKIDTDDVALFLNSRGGRLSVRSIWTIVNSVGDEAGIEDLGPHVLRHTALTILVRESTDLVLVAEIAGHRRLETTRRYTLPSQEDRAAAMDALDVEH